MELPPTFQRNARAFLHTFCLKMSPRVLCVGPKSHARNVPTKDSQQLKNTLVIRFIDLGASTCTAT
eukprot:719137-Amphidinium_carterae.1